MKANKFQGGFTIVEIVLSIATIAIMAVIVYVSYNGVQDNARRVAALSDLDNASSILEHDLQKAGAYPTVIEDADNGGGIESSNGTTFQYAANNTGSVKRYCLSATNGSKTYNITQEGKVSTGYCPVMHYDAAYLTSYSGSGAAVGDLGTGGVDATIIGSVSVGDFGSFRVTNSGDRIESNSVPVYGNNMTWGAWVNCAQSINSYNMFMGRYQPYFGFYTGNSLIFSNYISGTQRTVRSTPANLQLNTWYYTVFTTDYDGANMTMSIYINGVKNISASFPGTQSNLSYKYVIGDGRSTWYPFRGMVSDVRVHDYTMSEDEIGRLFEEQRSRYGI